MVTISDFKNMQKMDSSKLYKKKFKYLIAALGVNYRDSMIWNMRLQEFKKLVIQLPRFQNEVIVHPHSPTEYWEHKAPDKSDKEEVALYQYTKFFCLDNNYIQFASGTVLMIMPEGFGEDDIRKAMWEYRREFKNIKTFYLFSFKSGLFMKHDGLSDETISVMKTMMRREFAIGKISQIAKSPNPELRKYNESPGAECIFVGKSGIEIMLKEEVA